MGNLLIIIKKRIFKKDINFKQEALRKNCFEQFEKLLSRGLNLPISLL
jgi:hypothetical protein